MEADCCRQLVAGVDEVVGRRQSQHGLYILKRDLQVIWK